MQKIIVFKKHDFWTNQPNIDVLNEKIANLNSGGWKVVSIATNSNFLGIINSYSILIEMVE